MKIILFNHIENFNAGETLLILLVILILFKGGDDK